MRKVLRDVCLSVAYGAGMIAAGVSAISLIFGGFVGAYWVLGDRRAQAAMLLWDVGVFSSASWLQDPQIAGEPVRSGGVDRSRKIARITHTALDLPETVCIQVLFGCWFGFLGGAKMNVSQLIERLEEYREMYGDDAEVRIMTQQNWPFGESYPRSCVRRGNQRLRRDRGDDDGDAEDDDVIYIVGVGSSSTEPRRLGTRRTNSS